jgi:hypothetical protein
MLFYQKINFSGTTIIRAVRAYPLVLAMKKPLREYSSSSYVNKISVIRGNICHI